MKQERVFILLIAVGLIILATFVLQSIATSHDWIQQISVHDLGSKNKSNNCRINGALPDFDCTPGAIFENATASQICTPGYSRSVRNVPVSLKKQIYAAYGINYPQPTGSYELDHLIPLELGGNNEAANLFPESATPAPGYHQKDLVENFLHAEVCAGRVELNFAQKAIAQDWLKIYQNLSAVQIWRLEMQFRQF